MVEVLRKPVLWLWDTDDWLGLWNWRRKEEGAGLPYTMSMMYRSESFIRGGKLKWNVIVMIFLKLNETDFLKRTGYKTIN